MSEIQAEQNKPIVGIRSTNPELWEKEGQDSLLGFFKLILKIDMQNNPKTTKVEFLCNFKLIFSISKNDFFNIIGIFVAILSLLLTFGQFVLQTVDFLR